MRTGGGGGAEGGGHLFHYLFVVLNDELDQWPPSEWLVTNSVTSTVVTD